ncbi:MAG: hypothetical protein IJT24_02950 [Lachnospiraceae bacterium]|nr:hypothetical protein [Lachnospiraceae bacterium]
MNDTNAANERAVRASKSLEELDLFLIEEQQHILRLTGKVLGKKISAGDDEYSVALSAVSEAVGSYDADKGDFWTYAAFVIKSRETNYYRKNARTAEHEFPVSPEAFGGDPEDDDADRTLVRDISEKTAVTVDMALKDELDALDEALQEYGIDFFDLAECSPKARKSRESCVEVIKAIFTPPPLTDEIRRSRTLPIKKILERRKVSRKLIDRHRKYLISSAVILAGDYPAVAEYLPFRRDIQDLRKQ